MVREAHMHGVSNRKIDDLVKALWVDGLSKSEVFWNYDDLDTDVGAIRTRALTGEHRCL